MHDLPIDMRLVLVNQWHPPDYGGVGVYNGVMARAYVELGHDVTVITARSHPDQPDIADEDGVRVYRVDRRVEPYRARQLPVLGGHVRSLRHLVYSRGVSALLKRLARERGFDLAEFAEINAEGLFTALRDHQAPIVVRCHTPHVLLRRTTPLEGRVFDTSLIEWAERLFIQRATALTAPSADLAREVEREMHLRPGRIKVVPNAIDVAEFSPGPSNGPRPSQEALTILYVGRLEREKGIFVLAEALARLAADEPEFGIASTLPWRVIVAGGDRRDASGASNKDRLRQFFAQHNLADRVELRGFVAQDDLVDLYRSADLCVVPSVVYESFSYTCLQAMACGKLVVATTMGGIPEVVVDGETGLLVKPNDPVALAQALHRLIDDATLRRRLGLAGRERAVRLYGHHVVAAQNLALYADAMERRRQATVWS